MTPPGFRVVRAARGRPGLADAAPGAVDGLYTDAFPTLSGRRDDRVFGTVTDRGVFFILLHTGIDKQPGKIVQHSRASMFVVVAGMVLPPTSVPAPGAAFPLQQEFRTAQMLFVDMALTVTAVPATVKVLIDSDRLDTWSGRRDRHHRLVRRRAPPAAATPADRPDHRRPGTGRDGYHHPARQDRRVLRRGCGGRAVPVPPGGRFRQHVREKESDFSAMPIAAFPVRFLGSRSAARAARLDRTEARAV